MKLYNSKTQTIEDFTVRDHEVTLYVCGITPYDTTHLGHAFTYITYDQLIRYLALQGIRVRYAHNVNDMIALNVRPPYYYPRATDVIPEIVQSVEALLEAGLAYVKNGSVYYDIHRYPDFGQLSHLPYAEMLPVANERGNSPDDPNKRDPLDFVLWQAQAPGEPAWDSPWGPGRPGWHIECSTMATKLLGDTVDIHGGGADLLFPHHECETAQA